MTTSHYVIGDSSPFLKRVLIPFYVIRVGIMGLNLAALALILIAIGSFRDEFDDAVEELEEDYDTSVDVNTGIAILAISLVIVFFCLVLDLVSIFKRARRTLSPRFFLIANVVQTTIWTVEFVLSMIGPSGGLVIGVGVIVYLSFFGMLIYAAVIFHKFRKGTLTYGPASQNDQPFNPNPNGNYGYSGGSGGVGPAPPYQAAVQDQGYYGKQQVYEMNTQPQQQYGWGNQGQQA